MNLADPPDAAVVHRDAQPDNPPDAGPVCVSGGCGLDEFCVCHGEGARRRCWGTQQRCEQDVACCSARGDCQGTAAGEDTCSRQVRALSMDSSDAGVIHGG